MNKTIDRLYVWGFLTLLGAMSLFFFSLPKEAFSEEENRSLQEAPKLTWDNVWSKRFADEAELYVTDHFPFRSNWIAAKSVMEQLRLQKENNGIYYGKDGYLFEKFGEPDYAELEEYTDAMKQFAANRPGAEIRFLLSPNSVSVYPEKLPWLATVYPQRQVHHYIEEKVRDQIGFLNGFDFLKPDDSGKDLFYRTDHHWTTYGAYLAYRAYAESMGWEPLAEDDFNIRTVTDSFLGSYHTRGQFGTVQPDSIQVYEPKQPVETEMYIADTDETRTRIYDDSFLEKKDKYAYFQGGVHALVTLKSRLAAGQADLEKLLIFKDSYAHSMVPFLTNHVQEIHMIDIRYYNGSISDYMEQNGIGNVLLLFNTSTFIEERGLLKLKY